eukprot:147473_1
MAIAERLAFENCLISCNQEHVLNFSTKCEANDRALLAEQLEQLEISHAVQVFNETLNTDASEQTLKMEPFPDTFDVSENSQLTRKWRSEGLQMIARGEVALVVLGGGQGTRLGFSKPKGLYDIGMPSGKSIFQMQAERIIRLKQLAARESNIANHEVKLPWYIMTSDATHSPTVDYFKENKFFGLPSDEVMFFQQSVMPCFDTNGKVLMKSNHEIATSPDGSGGVFKALDSSGILESMKRSGIEYIHMFNVDNVLVKVGDPVLFGHSKLNQVDICAKVSVKTGPHEAVGVVCLRSGRPGVVEYSEIPPELAEKRNERGELVYGQGNIGLYCFRTEFLEKVVGRGMKYHAARKKVPYMSETGELIQPSDKNGIKLELFLFDVFCHAQKMTCLQVPRESEFAPVKNAPGTPTDSPDTARALLSALNVNRIEAAGGNVAPEGSSGLCEISPLISYDGEDLEAIVSGKTFDLPVHLF